MATYNGEKYLPQQLQSLIDQTYKDFKVIIYDDCSTDSSFDIIKQYAEDYPDVIFAYQNKINSTSAKYNFMNMMIGYKDDYIMLCDQDDVWLDDKIEITLEKMSRMEQKYGKQTPLLTHTDLTVVDDNLNVISPSFREAMNADYSKTELRQQLIQNTLTGCTCMYNRAVADLIVDVPDYCVMHDWFLMLVVSAFGKIEALPNTQTILYRQHKENQVGAKDVRTLKYKINKLLNGKDVRRAINETYTQAESFYNIYKNKLSNSQISLLKAYINIPNLNKFGRWRTIVKLGVLKNGIARKIANFIFI